MEWLIPMAASGVLGVIAWLLKNKDAAQEHQISELWEKHNEDSRALQDLRVQIAQSYYVKHELDMRFDKLESAFRDGFRELGEKFDKLAERMAK